MESRTYYVVERRFDDGKMWCRLTHPHDIDHTSEASVAAWCNRLLEVEDPETRMLYRMVKITETTEVCDNKVQINAAETGLYRVHWRSGGTSLASIWCDERGERWLAPTNWVRPGRLGESASDIMLLEALDIIPRQRRHC